MTLLINKDFVCHGIRVTIALPESYDATKTYPAVFLNDGQLDNPMKIREVKKSIAQIKTIQRERELNA